MILRRRLAGLKPVTEATDQVIGGRGAFLTWRSHTVRSGGMLGSENVGLSSAKTGENPVRRKSKVSWGRLVLPGLVGPKARPRGVVEG